jgi:hypothetical protein
LLPLFEFAGLTTSKLDDSPKDSVTKLTCLAIVSESTMTHPEDGQWTFTSGSAYLAYDKVIWRDNGPRNRKRS